MNKLHKKINQATIETYSYCGDINTYTISIIKQPLESGDVLLESWYCKDGEGVAFHACGLLGDNDKNINILINEAIAALIMRETEDYEN